MTVVAAADTSRLNEEEDKVHDTPAEAQHCSGSGEQSIGPALNVQDTQSDAGLLVFKNRKNCMHAAHLIYLLHGRGKKRVA